MIIDAHAHAFPDHGGASGYPDVQTNLRAQQSTMANFWGRMLTNTLERKYIPGPDEDVNFRVGKYGRYYWKKYGREIWLQRFPPIMVEAEWTPEQMVAFMDFAGVEKAVLQAGYMEPNYCRQYFAEALKKFPGRFIGTIVTEYDMTKSEKRRMAEVEKIRHSWKSWGCGAFSRVLSASSLVMTPNMTLTGRPSPVSGSPIFAGPVSSLRRITWISSPGLRR